jgi:hypothetical protein
MALVCKAVFRLCTGTADDKVRQALASFRGSSAYQFFLFRGGPEIQPTRPR